MSLSLKFNIKHYRMNFIVTKWLIVRLCTWRLWSRVRLSKYWFEKLFKMSRSCSCGSSSVVAVVKLSVAAYSFVVVAVVVVVVVVVSNLRVRLSPRLLTLTGVNPRGIWKLLMGSRHADFQTTTITITTKVRLKFVRRCHSTF